NTRFDCDWSSDVCSSDLKRVELHRRAGEAILLDPPLDDATTEALLSLHFFRAQEWDRAWKHARAAARDAANAYAPMEAATHLERDRKSTRLNSSHSQISY